MGTRGRLGTMLAALAVLVAVGGCTSDSRGTSSLGQAPGTEGGTATVSPALDATAAPELTVVQAKGFLQAADLGDGGTAEILPSDLVVEARVNPCGGRLPSDDSRLARAAAHVLYRFEDVPDSIPSGTAYEVITRYRGGGATAYLTDLRAAVERCPSTMEGEAKIDFAIEDSGFVGDESVLVSERWTYDFEGDEIQQTLLIAAVRVGELIVIIDAAGWEMASTYRPDLDRLIAAALVRAKDA